jgi:hypothetical protein
VAARELVATRTRVAIVAATRSGRIVRTWREPMLWKTRFKSDGRAHGAVYGVLMFSE